LSRFDGFTGINNHMGSRFTAWPDGMEIVLQTLNERGLLFLDSLTNTRSIGPALARVFKTPFAVRDVFIDHDRTDEFIIKQLALTERLARRNGHAIAIGHPHDLTVNRLKQWLATVESRGFTLVPVSAIIRSNDAHG
ncbi:MAG: divergent polysaccharide deacetylase family protein, partial [Alphaproteobacteria bacterium]